MLISADGKVVLPSTRASELGEEIITLTAPDLRRRGAMFSQWTYRT